MNTVSKYARRLIAGARSKDIAADIHYSVDHVNEFRSGRSESLAVAERIIEECEPMFLDKLFGYNALKNKAEYLEKQNQQYRLMLMEAKK